MTLLSNIYLSGLSLGNSECQIICDALVDHPYLQVLVISKNRFTGVTAGNAISSLIKRKFPKEQSSTATLKLLDISSNSLGNNGGQPIFNALLCDHSQIETLNIANCDIEMLLNSEFESENEHEVTRVHKLVLDDNPLKTWAVTRFSNLVAMSIYLKDVSFKNCGLSDEGARSLFDSACRGRRMNRINFSQNHITDVGVESIANVIDYHARINHKTHIEYLSLAGNMITGKGVKALLNVL